MCPFVEKNVGHLIPFSSNLLQTTYHLIKAVASHVKCFDGFLHLLASLALLQTFGHVSYFSSSSSLMYSSLLYEVHVPE